MAIRRDFLPVAVPFPDGDKALLERAVVAEFDAPVPGASAKHAIDLDQGIGARLLRHGSPFRQRAKRRAHTPGIDQGRRRTGRLLRRAPRYADGPFGIEDVGGPEPLYERVEVAEDIDPDTTTQIVGVHEVEPQSFADKNEGRWSDDHLGQRTG